MPKNVPLSLTVSPEVHTLLVARASTSEVPVRPATLAAHLLAKALQTPHRRPMDLATFPQMDPDDLTLARAGVTNGIVDLEQGRALLAFHDAVQMWLRAHA